MSGGAKERCANCRFYVPNEHQQTLWEEYEADTRPERPRGIVGALRWLWNPAKFRISPPDHEIDKYVDGIIRESNNSGRCVRHPQPVKVSPLYRCGEYQRREA